ncbi:MAG: RGCVC family protein [Pseudonocardia sp.]
MSELSPTGTTAQRSADQGPQGICPVEPTDAEQACLVCPHPWPGHDHLGMRYCTATIASASSRGCICR